MVRKRNLLLVVKKREQSPQRMGKGGGRRRARSEMGIGCREKRVKERERERKRELSFVRVPFSQSQRQSEKKTVLRLYFLLLQIWATKQTAAGTGSSWISSRDLSYCNSMFYFLHPHSLTKIT